MSLDKKPSDEIVFWGVVKSVEVSPGPTDVLPSLNWVVSVQVQDVLDGDLPLSSLSFRMHSPSRGFHGTSVEPGKIYEFHIVGVSGGYRVIDCMPLAEGLASTKLQADGAEILVTREDLVAIRRALLAKASNHPDKERLLPLLKDAYPVITEDGTARVGVFVVTADGTNLKLEFAPMPTTGIHDTFGFVALVAKTPAGWSVQSIHHAHYRWRQ